MGKIIRNGITYAGSTLSNTVFYGTCTGQAANQTKAVVVDSSQGFTLTAGIILFVKFDANNTYSATAEAPVKLNVNSTGAKNIYFGASDAPTGTNTTPFGRTNYVNQYYYDGTNWVWTGSSADNNTTYSNMSATELNTGTATTGRSISAKTLTDWLVSKLTNVAYKNVDNAFTVNQTINRNDGTTSAVGNSYSILGNNIPSGTAKNSRGILRLFGKGDKYVQIYDDGALTANRNINLPDKSGTIALTSDLTQNVPLNTNITLYFSVNFSQGIGTTTIVIPKPCQYRIVIDAIKVKKMDSQTWVDTTAVSDADFGCFIGFGLDWAPLGALGVTADCLVTYHYTI